MTAIRIRIAMGIVMVLACPCGLGQSGSKQSVPRFEDYKVAKVYRGVVRPPIFGDVAQYEGTDLRCFSGDSSEYIKEPVNFAGRFVIESCSCGSGCHYLFMWDAQTGRFYRIPVGAINVGPFDVGGSDPVGYKGEEYHSDSSLLVVDGCVEGTCDCAARYYQWKGDVFSLVVRLSSRLPSRCRK